MVLWLKQNRHLLGSIVIACLITCFFMYPYLVKDLLPVEHDTFFHLSRIDGLAKSIRSGIWIPSIYPDKNNGFGYASPLFYCDIFLIPYALLHLCGIPLSICYKTMIFCSTLFACLAMMHLTCHVTKHISTAWIISIAYTFSNYHITDVYVRGALGEVMAMIFLPIMVEGVYRLFYEHTAKDSWIYTVGLTGLLLCHNLTFLMGVILSIVFFLCSLKTMNRTVFLSIVKAVLFAFGMTVFFTLPMIEQLQSNRFYLHYYGSSSDLAAGSLPLWKYFANRTVFGYSNRNLEPERSMLLNVGYFLQFVPLVFLFLRKKENNPFFLHCICIGYICLILPIEYIPWDGLTGLRILQFPWRLLQISMVLLCIPAAEVLHILRLPKALTASLAAILLIEGFYHVSPVTERTFGLSSEMTWSQVQQGALTNPYYSATYMRVELAGGDYLPLDSIDYRTIDFALMRADYTSLQIPLETDSLSLQFSLDETYDGEILVIPKTYYKGYHLYHIVDDTQEEIPLFTMQGLAAFETQGSGTYRLTYEDTWLKRISMGVSFMTFLIFLSTLARKKEL